MLSEKQTAEKNAAISMSVVRKKSSPARAKVIRISTPAEAPMQPVDLRPPVSQFNTSYLKVKDHDPL